MIEKMIRIGRLYDVYGELLTERQRKCLDLHYLQDLSLGEIAAELGVSRQAINDILHRTEELLEQYEEKLKLLEQDENRTELLMVVSRRLQRQSRRNILLKKRFNGPWLRWIKFSNKRWGTKTCCFQD